MNRNLEDILEDHLDVEYQCLTLNWSQLLEITIIESERCLNMTGLIVDTLR